MPAQGPLPYLEWCGTEIANAARTVEYLRNGLGESMQGHWILGDGELCGVLYRLNGGDCITPDSFVSPALDPAPWYDPDTPGSSTFLGLFMLGISGYDSTLTRIVAPRIQGLGGGVFTGQRRAPREWKFRAAMISSDDAGAEFGLRWLTSVLQASACDTCSTCDLTVRLVCPPDDCTDDSIGEWTSYEVALTDGPKEVEQWSPKPSSYEDALIGCRDLVVVEWTMTAGNPFLYQQPQLCLAAEIVGVDADCTDICDFLFGDPGTPHCCSVDPPVRGVLGGIFTFESVSGMNDVLIEGYATCPTADEEPVTSMEIAGVPAGGTVVVDGAKHKITLTIPDPDTGELITSDGQSLIVLGSGGIEWPEIRDCDDIFCFCARTAHPCSQGGDTTVQIETQLREG